MKLWYDFIPFLLFFGCYHWYNFYVATAVLIAVTVLQWLYQWRKFGHVAAMQTISMLLIVLMGGSTLIFHNDLFLKWKTTIICAITAFIFAASHFIGDKVLLQRMLKQISLPNHTWRRFNIAWVLYFIFLAFANSWVAFHYSTTTWVYFKLFGIFGLTMLFILLQALLLAKRLNTQ